MDKSRLVFLQSWLKKNTKQSLNELVPLQGDASFRRYFRASLKDKDYVIMDCSSERKKCNDYLNIKKKLDTAGIRTAKIFYYDPEEALFLLEDLGNQLLYDIIDSNNTKQLYSEALDILTQLQKIPPDMSNCFDSTLLIKEMRLFTDWFLIKLLQYPLSEQEYNLLEQSFNILADKIVAMPYVFTHRDYHSRNLMWQEKYQSLAVIDFQDALYGPLCYDAVSLLKDAYITWPEEQVLNYLYEYHEKLKTYQLIDSTLEFQILLNQFNEVATQRHLKVVGIFARLFLRDGKKSYLKNIPRLMGFLTQQLTKIEELEDMSNWLSRLISNYSAHWNFS